MGLGTACKHWNNFVQVDYFWKYFYDRDFKPRTLILPSMYSTWKDLFKKHHSFTSWRLVGRDTLSDEVWTANFSPNGEYLAFTGLSGEVKILRIIQEKEQWVIFTYTFAYDIVYNFSWNIYHQNLKIFMLPDPSNLNSIIIENLKILMEWSA